MRPAEGRVTPNWTAGRRETGSPHACLDGRPVGDRVAAREGASEATGHRRRTGSLQNGRPAGGGGLMLGSRRRRRGGGAVWTTVEDAAGDSRPPGRFAVVFATEAMGAGEFELAIPTATLAVRLPKSSFLTLRTSTSSRRQRGHHHRTDARGDVEMVS